MSAESFASEDAKRGLDLAGEAIRADLAALADTHLDTIAKGGDFAIASRDGT